MCNLVAGLTHLHTRPICSDLKKLLVRTPGKGGLFVPCYQSVDLFNRKSDSIAQIGHHFLFMPYGLPRDPPGNEQ